MIAKVKSAAVQGIDGYIVDVEVDISFGQPGITTVGLPDNAVISSVRLKVRSAGVAGNDPFKDGLSLAVDICKPPAYRTGKSRALEARIVVNCAVRAGMFGRTPNSGWYTVDFPPAAFDSINLAGETQFRLRAGDLPKRDGGRGYLKLFSGEAGDSNSPLLRIRYSLPSGPQVRGGKP